MLRKAVVIVGGGVAGLTCARNLEQQNIDYLLLEGSDRVGGRLKTDFYNGFLLDRGFHTYLTAYPEARKELDYSQLDLRHFWQGVVIWTGQKFLKFTDPFNDMPVPEEAATGHLEAISDRIRIDKLRKVLNSKSIEEIRDHEIDTDTLNGLRAWGFSDLMIDRFFRPFLGTLFMEDELSTSYKKFEFLFKMFCGGKMAIPAAGIEAIPRQILSHLPGDRVTVNAEVTGISEDNVVTLNDGRRIQAEQVILATNLPQAYRLLGYSMNPPHHQVTCAYLTLDKAPFESPVLILNGSGKGRINNICFPNHVASSYAPEGKNLVSVSILGIHNQSGTNMFSEIREELRGWFGDRVSKWRPLKIYRINYALPEQQRIRPIPDSLNALRRKNIYLCGDYCEMACINGAIESGRKIADEVVYQRALRPV